MKRITILLLFVLLLGGILGCSARKTATVTGEDAQNIALQHAGLEKDQVRDLHIEYEVELGVPQFEVEFHYDGWEYNYWISAESGEILSQSRESEGARP